MRGPKVISDLTLDVIDSSGRPLNPIDISIERLMAFSPKGGGVWYGFIISDSRNGHIDPGTTSRVDIAFLNHDGAMEAFPLHSYFIFGNGMVSYGVAVLREIKS